MKLTDLSLIFFIILIPIIIIVYISSSYVVKSAKEEMYYESLINIAVDDATSAMKQVRNEDEEIDCSYSDILDNKVIINADTAIQTFYSSLFKNFGISGNSNSEERLKEFVPAIAILDYDGIYIHSAEKFQDGKIKYITKPKIHYLINFCIIKQPNVETIDPTDYIYVIKKAEEVATTDTIIGNHIYQVNFTMDDYIYLNIYIKDETATLLTSERFYLGDKTEIDKFIENIPPGEVLSLDLSIIRGYIVTYLEEQRQKTIATIAMEEIACAVNKHNEYVTLAGTTFQFALKPVTDDSWYETSNGIGMIAIVQGIPVGNRYLNHSAYGFANLTMVTKYYINNEIIKYNVGGPMWYMRNKLYHSSESCPIYQQYLLKYTNEASLLNPKFFYNKNEAASNGYLPCPICKP